MLGKIIGMFGGENSLEGTTKALFDGVDKVFTSDEERAQGRATIEKIVQQPHILQAMANNIAASHNSWFVAGARPFILWVCGLNLLQLGIAATWFKLTPPQWYVDMTATITLGVLGLYGTMRSIDKRLKVKQDKEHSPD